MSQEPVAKDVGNLLHGGCSVLAQLVWYSEQDLHRKVMKEDAACKHDGRGWIASRCELILQASVGKPLVQEGGEPP